jgi:putative membrane protein
VRGDRWFLGRIFYYPNGGMYFGVPLSNFAGWLVVGTVGLGGYIYGWGRTAVHLGTRAPRHDKPMGGIALYYAVLGFNLAVTAWIGEWVLLAIGLVLHTTVAALVLMLRRRPLRWAEMESQKA